MQSPFDSTLATNKNDSLPLRKELDTLIAKIQLMESEYNLAVESYKPFISGAHLYEIQKSLNNSHIVESNSPHALLLYLKEILNLHLYIKQFLSEIHQPLVTDLTESEFRMLHAIILKMEHGEFTLPESLSLLETANQIFGNLVTEQEVTPTATEVKNAINHLNELLHKRDLQKRIDDELQIFFNINFDLCADLNEFISAITPIREQLSALNQEANTLGDHDSVDRVALALNKSYSMEARFIKGRLDRHIELIHQNPWVTIEIKKDLYMNLLYHYDAVLKVFSALTLTDFEKDLYINQLHTGFELCLDLSFLELMTQSAHLFYKEAPEKLDPITNYAEQSKNKINLAHPILKKKRVRFEEQDPGISSNESLKKPGDPSPAKKRTEIELGTTDDEIGNTLLAQSFINIIAPTLKSDELPSRRFASAMLKALGTSVWSISGLDKSIKFTIQYDLLRQALALCPEDDINLIQKLNEQLNSLSRGNERMISDYNKFGAIHTQKKTGGQLTQESFKRILSDFTTQLTIYIRPEASDRLIEELLDNWKKNLISDGFVNHIYIEQMMNAIQGRNPAPRALILPEGQGSSSSTHIPQREFKSITNALCVANPSEFRTYLTHLKTRMVDPRDCLNYLVNKNRGGNTPLHSALFNGAFKNMAAYLTEVKELYGHQTSSFRSFLTSQNKAGFTFLHQVAFIGNMDLLQSFTQFLKTELGDTGYAYALRMETAQFFRPFCNERASGYKDINAFLDTELTKHPVPREKRDERRDSTGRTSIPPTRESRNERDGFFSSRSSSSQPSPYKKPDTSDGCYKM
jgi:hypothetical protein